MSSRLSSVSSTSLICAGNARPHGGSDNASRLFRRPPDDDAHGRQARRSQRFESRARLGGEFREFRFQRARQASGLDLWHTAQYQVVDVQTHCAVRGWAGAFAPTL
jgi:hypothetical protein